MRFEDDAEELLSVLVKGWTSEELEKLLQGVFEPKACMPPTWPSVPGQLPSTMQTPPAAAPAAPAKYEQAIFKPELAHSIKANKLQRTWDVLGPDGYYKACHHEDEAEALAAFWSGDQLRAEEFRRRALHRRGLITEEEQDA